ncbi:Nucleoporin GLE1 [Cytospora mali]|uniref:mRNA export factor GLE1 n=1 Tax=Cytospora mali TaxID=578113 RepID=A0A194V031_CYTMA|nr:Nucleoporin GLE1 [Valsa mali var. pyri (nom. inval.)]
MTTPSPAHRASRYPRANIPTSTSANSSIADFLSPDRNSEQSHKDALAAAAAEHERIRAKAEHTLYVYEQLAERNRLEEQTRREQERIKVEQDRLRAAQEKIRAEEARLRAEQAARDEQKRLQDIAAKKVSPLTPQSAPAPAATPTSFSAPTAQAKPAPPAQPPAQPAVPEKPAAPAVNSNTNSKPATSNPFAAPTTTAASTPAIPAAAKPTPAPASGSTDPKRQRALEIHKNLKQLRAGIASQGNQNKALKNKAGDLRRELRKSVGQLSMDKKGNQVVVQKIVKVLKEALLNEVGSPMVDPSLVVFAPRQPVEGAVHNAELPCIFIFLLNHLSKAIINQCISEVSVNTKSADPIGVCAASIFSDPAFHWRGQPLIDVLIAKFYVVCPVLFGVRASEKTERGRDLVAWKRRGNAWIPENEHIDRQRGLGAGYAAIALRDFSRSKKQNPYPMSHYWEAMAKIVNTPPSQMSNTQCIVLKAMIEHYEQRFLQFYGNAAVAALRLALVDFPTAAMAAGLKDSAVQSLLVHGQLLKAKVGLDVA